MFCIVSDESLNWLSGIELLLLQLANHNQRKERLNLAYYHTCFWHAPLQHSGLKLLVVDGASGWLGICDC